MLPLEVTALMAKAGAFIGGPYAVYKAYLHIQTIHRARKTDDLKIITELIGHIGANAHPLLIEKTYAVLTGDTTLSAGQIKHLLSLPNPGRAIADLNACRDVLEISEVAGEGPTAVKFRGDYADIKDRKFRKTWHGSWYWVQSLMLIGILIAPVSWFGKQGGVTSVILFVSLAILAIVSLRARLEILRAERFMESIQPTSKDHQS